ncbi:MAG: T9SS type A sorting domain-containing protein, partial [Bacteroidales bacterium]|nr:T9SS type A sorting domain-containing protein [Bacteroidales bacterium]
MLRVSDADDIFSGDIVCGIGHLTSFFPERLMDNGDGIRVEGLRCYWIEDELVFKYGDEDCDAIYSEVHGVEEDGPSMGLGTLTVYPNPTNGILTIHHSAFRIHHSEFQIANLMGQTVLSGNINAENQQIDVSSLPQGMYFITVGEATRKFVVD